MNIELTTQPTTAEVAELAALVHQRVDRLLMRRGLLDDPADDEPPTMHRR